MGFTVLLALLTFCTVASAVDSEGTNFVFAFVRNANSDITNQVLTATVLNRNDQDCKFTLTYRPDFHKTTPQENITQVVPSLSAINVDIPSWYGWNYAGENVQDDVYLTLTGFSTCPVTVLANNYDNVTNQGDTYMVLPTNWGSQSFTFSLPPAITSATVQHYEQVFVLPTTDGTTRVTFVEIGNAQSVFYFNATYGNSPAVYVGARTSDSRPRTYHVMSDKPVLIVAGVTCAGINPSSCDHVAYMPHPPAASDCYAWDYYDDDHISYLPTTTQFFTDIPGSCLIGQNITSTLNDGVSRTMTIKPQMESPLWTITTTNANQLGVAFHNGGSNIHIARYYDGTKYNLAGGFIATSPSITQFHNDYSSFYTRNVNDTLEVYCTILSCASLTLDGASFVGSAQQSVTQKVDGASYYIFTVPVAQPGFHRLDLDPAKNGVYGYFVSGKNGQYSYGYEGGANKPTFVLAPATTQGPTTTNTAPTATTTGPTVPTATVPTVTIPVVTTSTTAAGTTATPPATSPTTAPTSTPGTSKQTSSVVTQSTAATTAPVATSTSSTQTSVTTPKPTTQTTLSTVVTTPSAAPITSTSTVSPGTSAQTSTTTQSPVVTSTATPVQTVATTTPTVATVATSTPSVATTATSTTTASPNPPQTTTATTPSPPVTTTATTQSPVATSSSTPTPIVTTPSTPKQTPPQTSVPTTATPVVTPVVITTPAPSTAGSTATQPLPGTTPTTTQAPVTTTTTQGPVTQTTPTTPRVVTQPATSTTTQNIPTTTPVVTVSSTAAPTTTPRATTQTTARAATSTVTMTTSQPSTSTQSSSVISLAIPTVLTILYALL